MISAGILLLSLALALWAAFAANRLLAWSGFATAGAAAKTAGRAERAPESQPKSSADRIGRIAARWTPQGHLQHIEHDLYWMRFTEHRLWRRQTAAAVLGRQVMFALGAAAVLLTFTDSSVLALAGLLLGWRTAVSSLRGAAKTIREQVAAELPEIVQLMAAESSSGADIDTLLKRVAAGTSFTARWLAHVIGKSAGRNVVGDVEHMQEGVLMAEAQASGDEALISLAVELSFVKAGVHVDELLASLAERLAQTYKLKADIRAEELQVNLALLGSIFYLVPYILGILIIIGISLGGLLG